MKNKLIFRILGALASALIIVSVFIPFINVTGFSLSLWESYEVTNSLYLPIMIIVFGAIGVIFFALNVKTEFAYMSVGAITFFAIMQTIDILDQGGFSTLSVGYYCLVIGTIVTGIMAFLTNLKSKKKTQVIGETKTEEPSMLDQINKLYNEQPTSQNNTPIQPIDNIVQPLPNQSVMPIQPVEPVVTEQKVEEIPENSVIEQVQIENTQVLQGPVIEQIQIQNEQIPVNPVLEQFNVQTIEETPVEEKIVEVADNQPVSSTPQEFSVPSAPIVGEPAIVSNQPMNPVLQEFSVPSSSIVEEPAIVSNQPINPVLQEFGISNTTTVEQSSQLLTPTLNQGVPAVPFSNISEPVVQSSNIQNTQTSTEFDIFGQPINKS